MDGTRTEETWAAPDGTLHPSAPANALAEGWIGAIPGSPLRIRLREGSVARKAVAAIKAALADVPPETPVACDWGDGRLGDTLARIRLHGWTPTSDPHVEVRRVLDRLEGSEREAAYADWLMAGLAEGPVLDDERFRQALAGVAARMREGSDAVRRLPPELDDARPAPAPEIVARLAAARLAEMDGLQARLERAGLDVTAAVAGARGEPLEPPPPPAPTGDVFVDLRRAQERHHASAQRGLDRVWRALPPESGMGRALSAMHGQLGLGARYLAMARRRIAEGGDARSVLSFYVQHECARHFFYGATGLRDVEAAWMALRDAAPSGAPTP